jgi:hypothetical protein
MAELGQNEIKVLKELVQTLVLPTILYIVITYTADDYNEDGGYDVSELVFLDLDEAKKYAEQERWGGKNARSSVYKISDRRAEYIP